jgi:hypothetical protein
VPEKLSGAESPASAALIPYDGYQHMLNRRFEEAIERFLAAQQEHGPSDAISSALAAAYRDLGLQTLANQVRRSVRGLRGNQWMFRVGHPADHALRIRPELLARPSAGEGGAGMYPVLRESTPVRMDLSHSGWSDIFFLGMDFPEGAKVLNISVDLGVHGRDPETKPPVSAWLRVIDEPVRELLAATGSRPSSKSMKSNIVSITLPGWFTSAPHSRSLSTSGPPLPSAAYGQAWPSCSRMESSTN